MLPQRQTPAAVLTGVDSSSCGGSGCAGTEGAVVKVLGRLQLPTPRPLKHCSNTRRHKSAGSANGSIASNMPPCDTLLNNLGLSNPTHACRKYLQLSCSTHPYPEGELLPWPQRLECEVCAVLGLLRALTQALVDDRKALQREQTQVERSAMP
jgi:hypothetical protein